MFSTTFSCRLQAEKRNIYVEVGWAVSRKCYKFTVFKNWLALATDDRFDRIKARKRVQIVVEGLVEG